MTGVRSELRRTRDELCLETAQVPAPDKKLRAVELSGLNYKTDPTPVNLDRAIDAIVKSGTSIDRKMWPDTKV